MSSGSYRLLPRTIENRLGIKRPVTQELVESTISRLSDKLHIRLLSEVIPSAFTSIRVGEYSVCAVYCVLSVMCHVLSVVRRVYIP